MANENDDVLKANSGAPAADIPDLKKKDKERKKAGAAWSGARGAAGEFSGATGGAGGAVSRAAASAASAAAEGALAGAGEAGGGLWAAITRFMAGMTSTLLGKMAVAAAAFLFMAAAGIIGYSLMKGGDAGLGIPSLGAISNSMKVRTNSDDRMAVAGKGELRFDPLSQAAQAKKADAPIEDKTAADKATDQGDHADAAKGSLAGQDKLAHTLSGAKLSSSLGGDFGNKNIFAGNSAAPKFNDAMAKVNLGKNAGQKGNLSAMAGKNNAGKASARSIGKARSSRAIGQLKMAKGMSMLGAQNNSAEGAASAAQGAFDQQQTNGGGLSTPMGAGDTVAPPSNGGAPDTSMPNAPSTPSGTAVDPGLQNAMDQIGQMADTARQMQQTGQMLLMIGAVLIAAGIALMAIWGMQAIGAMLIGLGGMMLGMGFMMMQMAQMMAQMAKSMGAALAAQTGNVQQAKVVNYCTDQALGGTATKDCNPPDSITNGTAEDAQNKKDIQQVKTIGNDKPVIEQTKVQ